MSKFEQENGKKMANFQRTGEFTEASCFRGFRQQGARHESRVTSRVAKIWHECFCPPLLAMKLNNDLKPRIMQTNKASRFHEETSPAYEQKLKNGARRKISSKHIKTPAQQKKTSKKYCNASLRIVHKTTRGIVHSRWLLKHLKTFQTHDSLSSSKFRTTVTILKTTDPQQTLGTRLTYNRLNSKRSTLTTAMHVNFTSTHRHN